MASGIIVTTADINNAIGGTARSLNVLMSQQIPQTWSYLQTIGSAGLQAAPFNFSSGDATNIMTVIDDLYNLSRIYTGAYIVTAGSTPGTGTPTSGNGYDFRVFAQRVWGLGY